MTREEAIRILEEERDVYIPKWIKYIKLDFFDRRWVNALELAIKALEQEPKTGHWISHREHCENLGVTPSGLGAYEWCSNCDCGIDVKEWYRTDYNYCPNCGAKMESEDKK